MSGRLSPTPSPRFSASFSNPLSVSSWLCIMAFSRLCSLSGALFVVLLSTQVGARRLPMVDSFLLPRETVSGFQLSPQGSFAGFRLADSCKQVLYQTINCDSSVANLGRKAYHGSPGDKAFTDTVCSTACSTALKTARKRVAGACASTSELFEGYPVLALIDSVISGWDETCLKDTDGGYCNGMLIAKYSVCDFVILLT